MKLRHCVILKKNLTSKTTLIQLLAQYLKRFPNETDRCKTFSDFLDRNADKELFVRKNFDGHITTSAFIIRVQGNDCYEILLLEHKSLKRWLQPGGHVEAGDKSLIASALREAVEETGIPEEELILAGNVEPLEVPFDIDSHIIPENPKKLENGHYHHDLRYLFLYTGKNSLKFNEGESTGMKWVNFNELSEDATFGMVITKIKNDPAFPFLQ